MEGTVLSEKSPRENIQLLQKESAKEETIESTAKEEVAGPSAKEETIESTAKEETAGSSAKKEATGPSAKEETIESTAKEEATGPSANEEATGPSANEKATGPSANEEATGPSANEEATGPSANEEATGPSANEEATGLSAEDSGTGYQKIVRCTIGFTDSSSASMDDSSSGITAVTSTSERIARDYYEDCQPNLTDPLWFIYSVVRFLKKWKRSVAASVAAVILIALYMYYTNFGGQRQTPAPQTVESLFSARPLPEEKHLRNVSNVLIAQVTLILPLSKSAQPYYTINLSLATFQSEDVPPFQAEFEPLNISLEDAGDGKEEVKNSSTVTLGQLLDSLQDSFPNFSGAVAATVAATTGISKRLLHRTLRSHEELRNVTHPEKVDAAMLSYSHEINESLSQTREVDIQCIATTTESYVILPNNIYFKITPLDIGNYTISIISWISESISNFLTFLKPRRPNVTVPDVTVCDKSDSTPVSWLISLKEECSSDSISAERCSAPFTSTLDTSTTPSLQHPA